MLSKLKVQQLKWYKDYNLRTISEINHFQEHHHPTIVLEIKKKKNAH